MGATLANAQVENLWITEVDVANRMVEVTNIGSESFTTTSSLPFCHNFNYGNNVPRNTTFAPGESRVFSVGLNASSSDIWLYRSSPFGVGANIISGLNYGPTPRGRTALATSVGLWDDRNSSLPVPAAGQSLQLTGADPFSAANWSVLPADLGNFVPAGPVEPVELAVSSVVEGDEFVLSWVGTPPFIVEESSDLETFTRVDISPDVLEHRVSVNDMESRFFRVRELEQTASYQVEFLSSFSQLTFPLAPAQPQFSEVIGGTHNEEVSFWRVGAPATSGLEQLAETGNTSGFRTQVTNAIAADTADSVIEGPGINRLLGRSTFTVDVDRDFPLMSIVSRFDDSPDWFTGVNDISFLSEEGRFIETVEIPLQPYDAGTQEGNLFGEDGGNTRGRSGVTLLQNQPPFFPGGIVPAEEVEGIGVLRITRVRTTALAE